MAPFIGTAEAIALGAIVGAALHDIFCAIWLFIYMGIRGRLKDTLAALKTRSGRVVISLITASDPQPMTAAKAPKRPMTYLVLSMGGGIWINSPTNNTWSN